MAESDVCLSLSAKLPIHCIRAGEFTPHKDGKYPGRCLDVCELIYVRKGSLFISEENRRFSVGPYQSLLLFPNRHHKGWQPNSHDLSYYWVYFSIDDQQGIQEDGLLAHVPQHKTVARPDHMVELLHRLLDYNESKASEGKAADLALLLALCEVAYEPPAGVETEATALMASQADAIIRSCFQKELSTSGIATRIGCSPDYLGRIYRSTYGISIVEAIHRRRIQRARHLLTMRELSIDEVAHECGFLDSNYFRRIFKRSEGMTPLHFQSLHAGTRWND